MHRITRCAATAILVTSSLLSYVQAATFELYDASLGSLPSVQSHLSFAGLGVSQTGSVFGVELDSTAVGNVGQGGYTNFGLTQPVLDRSTGVNLDFDLQVISESHASDHRSGFSIILLTSDSFGIELGFWGNEVWAQNSDFSHGEGAPSFDTTSGLRSYSLQILGSNYTLSADGGVVLFGELRNYPTPAIPYAIPNYIFIGDNTTSARGHVVLGDVTLTTTVVPLPPSVVLALVAFVTTLSVRRNREDVVQAPIT